MRKAEYKVRGGKLIRVQLVKKSDKIEKIKITGDFFLYPEKVIEGLEKILMGCPIQEGDLESSVKSFLKKKKATLLGASPTDLVTCIMMASDK